MLSLAPADRWIHSLALGLQRAARRKWSSRQRAAQSSSSLDDHKLPSAEPYLFFHRLIPPLSPFLLYSFSFCLFHLLPTPLSSLILYDLELICLSEFSVRTTVLLPPRFLSFPYSSLQKIVLCEMRQSRLAASISERQRDCKEVVKMTPPLGNTRPY